MRVERAEGGRTSEAVSGCAEGGYALVFEAGDDLVQRRPRVRLRVRLEPVRYREVRDFSEEHVHRDRVAVQVVGHNGLME